MRKRRKGKPVGRGAGTGMENDFDAKLWLAFFLKKNFDQASKHGWLGEFQSISWWRLLVGSLMFLIFGSQLK